MSTRELLTKQREAILDIARRHSAHDIRVFGSIVRSDTTESSDVDLIVRFEPGHSLFDHGGLLMDLRDLLCAKVDSISEGEMRPRFRERVMKEAIPL